MSRFHAGLRVKKEATFEHVETLAKMHKFSNALNACDEYLRSNMEQAKSERKLKELNPGAKKRSKEEMEEDEKVQRDSRNIINKITWENFDKLLEKWLKKSVDNSATSQVY